jgi:hypothetical protein
VWSGEAEIAVAFKLRVSLEENLRATQLAERGWISDLCHLNKF